MHKTSLLLYLTIVALMLLATASMAQQPLNQPPTTAAQKSVENPTDPSGVTAAKEESEEVIFERLTGFFVEGRGGLFLTVGGARGYSNAQPFFGFDFGYDITEHFSMELSYGSGYQAANPLKYKENCSGQNCGDYHLDFGLTFFNVALDYDLAYGRRWAFEMRAGGGVVIINPSAKPDQGAVDFDAFGGLRFEYYTLLKHFTLAVEPDYYYVMPTGIHALALSFSILYTF